MAFSRGSQKTVKKKKQEEAQKQKSCLLNENTFPGLLFKKNINNTHSTITALKNRPNIVLSEKNIVIFDYSNVKNEKDLNQLHATFSTMIPQKSTFILNNAHYVQDEFSINAEINGIYKFLNFLNATLVVAEAPSNLSGYDRMKWNSKFFIKTPQIEIFDEFQSSRNVDRLENLIDNPSFKDWGILVGDTIKFIGTKHNDDNAAMVIHINDEGTEITLSEILKNENTIGIPIKIQHYRICSEIKTDTIYETQKPIKATSHKKSTKFTTREIKPVTSSSSNAPREGRGACCVGLCNQNAPDGPRRCYGNRTSFSCTHTLGGSKDDWFEGQSCIQLENSNVSCCSKNWYEPPGRSSGGGVNSCGDGSHVMPDGTCMDGDIHVELPAKSSIPTPRTSTPPRGGGNRTTSTPPTRSTTRTSTPPPSMGGGGSGY